MSKNYSRPLVNLDPSQKVRFDSEFELVLLRWRYLLKSPNPKEEVFKQYAATLDSTTKRMYQKFKYAFSTLGYLYEDVRNISNMYLVSYLGVFSLNLPENYKKFEKAFIAKNKTEPTKEDILKKDKSNFTSFLIQRLEEAAKICAQKNRNIRGTDSIYEGFIGEKPLKEENHDQLLINPEVLGYKKLKKMDIEKFALEMGVKASGTFKNKEGKLIVIIEKGPRQLSTEDVVDIYGADPYYDNPYDTLRKIQEDLDLEDYKVEFDTMNKEDKKSLLYDFLLKNEKNPKMSEEVKHAQKILNRLG